MYGIQKGVTCDALFLGSTIHQSSAPQIAVLMQCETKLLRMTIVLLGVAAAVAVDTQRAATKPTSSLSELRQAVLRYFRGQPDYRAGDLATWAACSTGNRRFAICSAAPGGKELDRTVRERAAGWRFQRQDRPHLHDRDAPAPTGAEPHRAEGGQN
jgi:hypothetical protein